MKRRKTLKSKKGIDGLINGVDKISFKLLVSPRRAQSVWSARNKKIISRLLKEKRIAKPGLDCIAIAKKNGNWDRLNASDQLKFPTELARARKKNSRAHSYFHALLKSKQRPILECIYQAKKTDTRLKRVQATIRASAKSLHVLFDSKTN